MSLRLTFAERSTGIFTKPSGKWSFDSQSFRKVEGMHEALRLARTYLEQHPDHEAWIGSSVAAHRVALPLGRGFDSWIAQFRRDRSLGQVSIGITYGDVISMLGWPDDCSVQLKRSPMSVILRYQPKNVDFHFDDGGRLRLVHQDDPDDPLTILAA